MYGLPTVVVAYATLRLHVDELGTELRTYWRPPETVAVVFGVPSASWKGANGVSDMYGLRWRGWSFGWGGVVGCALYAGSDS